MYMRLVQARYKPDSLAEIREVYDREIIPELQRMRGCLFACLIRNEVHPDEGISLTLWDTRENAETYVKSGMFQELLGKIKPHLSQSSEWKIQLTKDLKVDYQPVPEEPVIHSYSSVIESDLELPDHILYLRLLSLKIKPEMMEEFRNIYRHDILPKLRTVDGCLYAYLTHSSDRDNEALSITIWQSREHADRYENSGMFQSLLEQVQHTLSDLYQWQMGLGKSEGWEVRTSEDAQAKLYSVVTGKGFVQTGSQS